MSRDLMLSLGWAIKEHGQLQLRHVEHPSGADMWACSIGNTQQIHCSESVCGAIEKAVGASISKKLEGMEVKS